MSQWVYDPSSCRDRADPGQELKITVLKAIIPGDWKRKLCHVTCVATYTFKMGKRSPVDISGRYLNGHGHLKKQPVYSSIKGFTNQIQPNATLIPKAD